jgi:PHD/YefM family antitoxin component YafN of YafNO toxin-antitoxin module
VPAVAGGKDIMVSVHPQYVVDENEHRQAVILPLAEWEEVIEELEELDDIRAYDEAKSGSQESASFEQAVGEIREGRVA